MLNPQFGIVNELGQSLLGWDQPIAFLSQARGTWELFGLDIPVPTADGQGHVTLVGLKDAPSAQLAEAIRRVAAGGRAIDPTLAAELRWPLIALVMVLNLIGRFIASRFSPKTGR